MICSSKNILLVFLCSFFVLVSCNEAPKKAPPPTPIVQKEAPPAPKKFGYAIDSFAVVQDTIRPGDSFGNILDSHGIDRGTVFKITNAVKDTFNVARLVAGKKYTLLKSKDTSSKAQVFIYQPNRIDYTIIDFRDSITAHNYKKPVTIQRRAVSGVITSSLFNAMNDLGLGISLTHRLSTVYQWSVDFFKIQKGDQFKVIYNERYVEDSIYVGIENVEAAVLKHFNRPYYAFEYQEDGDIESFSYYDELAKSLQSFFLKAPLEFSRISSRYSPRRFHPVQKRWKAHKGTDYAAPHGTPIWSTANGTVEKAGYTRGNGNYVKIKHNNTYATQYLHMSKILVKKGERVKQGDIIGRVGSTGLATGPHVCYRFWKNGKQVDPFRQMLPAAKDLKEAYKPAYFEHIAPLKKELDSIPYKIIEIKETVQQAPVL